MIRDSVTAAGTGARAIAYRTHIPTEFFFVRPLLSIPFRLISRRYTAKQAASRTLSRISHGEPADTRDDVVFSTSVIRSRTWLSAGSAVHISGKTAAAAAAEVPRRRYWPDETRGISENSQSISAERLSTAMSGPPAPDTNPPSAGLCR